MKNKHITFIVPNSFPVHIPKSSQILYSADRAHVHYNGEYQPIKLKCKDSIISVVIATKNDKIGE